MNPFSVLLILFLTIPMIEIYLLIKVGGIIGAWPTIFLVVFTAVLGAWLLRIQGFSTLARVRSSLEQGTVPAIEIMEGALLLISGALLLTPGFFTDAVGFICLVPAFRRALVVALMRRFLQVPPSGGGPAQGHHKGTRTIEGEYRRDDD